MEPIILTSTRNFFPLNHMRDREPDNNTGNERFLTTCNPAIKVKSQ